MSSGPVDDQAYFEVGYFSFRFAADYTVVPVSPTILGTTTRAELAVGQPYTLTLLSLALMSSAALMILSSSPVKSSCCRKVYVCHLDSRYL